MSDTVLFVVTVLAFAIGVTAHVTIVIGLARRPPRWRALAALIAAPLAPYWAVREKMRVRAAAWLVGAAVYAIARLVQRA